jgi:hypothetical protein
MPISSRGAGDYGPIPDEPQEPIHPADLFLLQAILSVDALTPQEVEGPSA